MVIVFDEAVELDGDMQGEIKWDEGGPQFREVISTTLGTSVSGDGLTLTIDPVGFQGFKSPAEDPPIARYPTELGGNGGRIVVRGSGVEIDPFEIEVTAAP